MRRWNRSQKYHTRPRTLYALLFDNGCCYIGQSADPSERENQHRRPAGGWCGRPFKFIALGVVDGTEAQAMEYEYAWRLKAQAHSWLVYAKPPGLTCDPRRRSTPERRRIAMSLAWPRQHSRKPFWKAVNALSRLFP